VRCSWARPTTSDPCGGAGMQGARRRPWWLPRASRATPQTPQRTDPPARSNTTVAHQQSALPTLRDRADFPSCGVVASLLGIYPTSSAPPCLRGNLPAVRGHAKYSDRLLASVVTTFLSAGRPRPRWPYPQCAGFSMPRWLRNEVCSNNPRTLSVRKAALRAVDVAVAVLGLLRHRVLERSAAR